MSETDDAMVRQQERKFLAQEGQFVSVSGRRIPFAYDPLLDVLILDGQAYSGDFFCALGRGGPGLPEGATVRIERRDPDGTLVLRRLRNVEEFLEGLKTV